VSKLKPKLTKIEIQKSSDELAYFLMEVYKKLKTTEEVR